MPRKQHICSKCNKKAYKLIRAIGEKQWRGVCPDHRQEIEAEYEAGWEERQLI